MQPKIYTAQEHRITPDLIDQHAFYIIEKLRTAGYTAYLVGGGVRDLLLGQQPKDFDISTSARPEEIRNLFRNAILIGRRFRLAHIRFGRKVIEVSTFRAGDPETAGLIVHDNEWGTEEQDVLRRDFTINGLFYDPETQRVIDYVGGYPDLEKRTLRAIGQPELRFMQDPVRMIRLLKFCARFNFDIDQKTLEALLQCRAHIVKSSPARILEELLRMLESGYAQPFFHLLYEYGLLRPLMPILARYLGKGEPSPTYHVLAAIDQEIRNGEAAPDRSLLLAALIFPLIDEHLKIKTQRTSRPLHLGQVAEESLQCIDHIFSPFFNIPRRMRSIASFLIVSQYRLLPLDGRAPRRTKPPKDPFFPMALRLFKLREALDPSLRSVSALWEGHGEGDSSEAPSMSARPARRRRRRPRSGPSGESHDS